jgi:glycosyltransferase involved in cell wall biosynthesis
MKVSACICTLNEEAKLPGLLDSLRGRVDEIVIVDGGSMDKTLTIAAKYTRSIYHGDSRHPDGDRHIYTEMARNDWILAVDADERFCPLFLEQLSNLNDQDIAGYWIARRNYYSPKKYYQHIIYPDYQLRLYDRRRLIKINDRIHSRPVFNGPLVKLPEEYYIEHLTPIFSDHLKYHRYALVQSRENPGAPSVSAAIHQFVQWYGYAVKTGCWLDGIPGLKLAYSQALYHYWLYRQGFTQSTLAGEAGEVRDTEMNL